MVALAQLQNSYKGLIIPSIQQIYKLDIYKNYNIKNVNIDKVLHKYKITAPKITIRQY